MVADGEQLVINTSQIVIPINGKNLLIAESCDFGLVRKVKLFVNKKFACKLI